MESCLNCNKYMTCEDKRKSFSYLCNKYKPVNREEIAEQMAYTNKKAPKNVDKLMEDTELLSEFNISRIVNEVLSDKSVVPIDIRLNDRHIPKAKNFYDFAVGEEFLNIKPFLWQCLVATIVFSEYCSDCSDLDWMFHDHKVTDSLRKFEKKVALLENGECPHCGITKAKLVAKDKINFYQEMAIVAGQRSGKSAVTAMMTGYIIHRVAKLSKPNEVYGLLHSNVLHGTFCALSFGMAKDLLYDPLYGYLIEAPWFVNYHTLLDEHQRKTGDSIFKLNDTFLMYRHRALVVAPVGPDRRTLRGKTRMFACIPGDALINTSKGLVRMDSIQVGDTACFGLSAEITKHECTGVKELYKLRLESGQELECSKEHKIATYVDGKIKKVKLSNLTLSDNVVFTVGGEFPEELELDAPFTDSKYLDRQSELYYQIGNLKTFTLSGLEKINTMTRASIMVYVNKLIREGHVSKTRLGEYKEGDRFTYSIISSYSYKEQVKGRNKGYYEKKHKVQYPTHMTPELATVLGYLVADGYNRKTELKFKCQSKERRDHFAQCVESVFGVAPNMCEHSDTSTTGERTYYYVSTIVYKKWIQFFEHIGLTLCYSADKVVPWSILQAPKDCVIAFLQALVECDGSFASTFSYNTISIELAKQVQQLIMKLGVPNYITSEKKNYKCEWKYGDRDIHHYHVKVDNFNCKELYRVFKSKLSISTINYEFANSRARFKKSPLTRINSFTYYTKVESVVSTGCETKVYDMTVEHETHVYQANGILVSNSIDEIGHFDNSLGNDKVKMNANEIYVALERSLLTIRASANRLLAKGFSDVPTGFFLNISSPFSIRDKVMELYRASLNSKKLYGLQKPTWELNPTVTYEDLKSEFDKDEVTAWRDYGAQPPLQSNAFISNEEAVQNCIGRKRNGIKMTFAQKRYKNDDAERYAKVQNVSENENPSILALDAGHTGNSFGFVCGHMDDEDNFAATIVAEVMPLPGIPLNFTLIYKEIITSIIESQNVVLVTADRWNSIKILSDIRSDFEIQTEQYSLKYKDMWFVKNYITESQIILPKTEKTVKECIEYDLDNYPYCYDNKPVEHLILQMLTVRDTGNMVIKGDGNMTDDIFRALCLAVHRIKDPKHYELFNAEYQEDSRYSPGHLAVVRPGSSTAIASSSSVFGSTGKVIAVSRRSKQ